MFSTAGPEAAEGMSGDPLSGVVPVFPKVSTSRGEKSAGAETFRAMVGAARGPLGPPMFGAGENRLTPMEIDAQLQAAELTYRDLLEGKRPSISMDIASPDAFYKEHFGEEWVAKNKIQRKEVQRQAKEAGENTPMWVEAYTDAADLAFEVLELGKTGSERLRQREAVDRSEVLTLLRNLRHKVLISHYARCGAGERLVGQRACVAVLWIFVSDSEVLAECADCLRLMSTGNAENAANLLALTQALPPEERTHGSTDRGWTFLRASLDAFAAQAGSGMPLLNRPQPQDQEEGDWQKVNPEDAKIPEPTADVEVAVKIAHCILAAKDTPALQDQLNYLREAVPENAYQEHRDLKEMLPAVVKSARALEKDAKGSQVAADLLELLKLAGDL